MRDLFLATTGVCGAALVASALGRCNWPRARPPLTHAQQARRPELATTAMRRACERIVLALLPWLQTQRWARALADRLAAPAARLAWPLGLTSLEWGAVSLVASVGVAALFGALLWSPVAFLLGSFLGAAGPWFWLHTRAQREVQHLLRAFPDFLDTVTLLVEAGLDFASAIERYTRTAAHDTLSRHLSAAVTELRTGRRLTDVIDQLDATLALDDLTGFFAGFRDAVQAGASLAPVLRIQAETLRTQRFERAEKMAARASVQLMLPLMLIFAAVLAIVLGPLAVQLIGGLG